MMQVSKGGDTLESLIRFFFGRWVHVHEQAQAQAHAT